MASNHTYLLGKWLTLVSGFIALDAFRCQKVELVFAVRQGAAEMGQMEHVLNVYVSKAAKGSVADFMGYVEVEDQQATSRLTSGLWLVRERHPYHR